LNCQKSVFELSLSMSVQLCCRTISLHSLIPFTCTVLWNFIFIWRIDTVYLLLTSSFLFVLQGSVKNIYRLWTIWWLIFNGLSHSNFKKLYQETECWLLLNNGFTEIKLCSFKFLGSTKLMYFNLYFHWLIWNSKFQVQRKC
jgi:hypothetical protein